MIAEMPKPKDKPKAPEISIEGMKVKKIGLGVFQCSSESDPDHLPYTVDIMANNALGQCDCWNFKARCYPRYRDTGMVYDSFRCKHLRRVRNFTLDALIRLQLKEQEKKS
jgi:hypothetical protein